MTSVMSRLRADNPDRDGDVAPESIGLLPIGADLLPREVVAVRRGRTTRFVSIGIVLIAVLGVVAGYVLSSAGRSTATDELATAQDRTTSLQNQVKQYTDVAATQAQATALRNTLAHLMATDAPWSALLGALDGIHGGAISYTTVHVSSVDPTAAATTTSATPGAIGTLTIDGKGPDKPAIAAFVDALSGLTGIANPFLTSATQTDDGSFTFTVQADLTPDLRTVDPSRWATTTTGGGK
jgi:type II secretory pathway pseudopilin PulG